MSEARRSFALAFAAAVAGIAIFSVMDAVMKSLVLAFGTYAALLWRNLASALLSGAIYWSRPRAKVGRAALRVHVVRGVVTTAMAVAFFWGLARVPMAQAVALTFVAPLLSLYLAAALLGERVRRTAVVASAIAFAGVVVILVGQWRADLGRDALAGAVAILASAVCYAFNIVLMRRQALVADPAEVAFSQSAIVTLVLAVAAPVFGTLPPAEHVPMILFAGVLAVVSLQLLAWAYRRGEANRLSTSEYTALAWAALLGWVVFDESVGLHTMVGAALIVAGCVVAARRERPVATLSEIAET